MKALVSLNGSISLLAVCLSVNIASDAQGKPATKCSTYGPAITVVSGKLSRKTFPGPPNYEDVNKGDAKETYWLVDLQRPMCVYEDKKDPDFSPQKNSVHRIQLLLRPEDYIQYKALVGKSVVAEGTLFGAISGHHHTPVLLETRSIKLK